MADERVWLVIGAGRGMGSTVFYRLTEPDRIDVLRAVHTARSPDTWPGEGEGT